MAVGNEGHQRPAAAGAARLRLTDTGVEVADESVTPATSKPAAESDAAKAATDAEETALLLDEGDAPADAAKLETTARRGRLRRMVAASGVVAGLLALAWELVTSGFSVARSLTRLTK